MQRMKTFWTYFLLFVCLYLFVSLCTYIGTKQLQRDLINYEILTESPQIAIEESKATYSKGYISGKITNNTGSMLENTVIKLSFYNSDKKYIDSKYKKIKYLNVDATEKFNFIYGYSNVDYITVELVDEIPR